MPREPRPGGLRRDRADLARRLAPGAEERGAPPPEAEGVARTSGPSSNASGFSRDASLASFLDGKREREPSPRLLPRAYLGIIKSAAGKRRVERVIR